MSEIDFELAPCPFCGSEDIRDSVKIAGNYELQYRVTMYCNKCYCYGPRIRTKAFNRYDYKSRDECVEHGMSEAKRQAAEAWNRRTYEKNNGEN